MAITEIGANGGRTNTRGLQNVPSEAKIQRGEEHSAARDGNKGVAEKTRLSDGKARVGATRLRLKPYTGRLPNMRQIGRTGVRFFFGDTQKKLTRASKSPCQKNMFRKSHLPKKY
jgi:hypothetical protein